MNTTLTTPFEAIQDAKLSFKISETSGELMINEFGPISFDIEYDVKVEYNKPDFSIGDPGGYDVVKVDTTLLAVYDEEGEFIQVDRSETRRIEKFLNDNLILEFYEK